jgi:hypothetical protein
VTVSWARSRVGWKRRRVRRSTQGRATINAWDESGAWAGVRGDRSAAPLARSVTDWLVRVMYSVCIYIYRTSLFITLGDGPTLGPVRHSPIEPGDRARLHPAHDRPTRPHDRARTRAMHPSRLSRDPSTTRVSCRVRPCHRANEWAPPSALLNYFAKEWPCSMKNG